jgi:hypothetical protein
VLQVGGGGGGRAGGFGDGRGRVGERRAWGWGMGKGTGGQDVGKQGRAGGGGGVERRDAESNTCCRWGPEGRLGQQGAEVLCPGAQKVHVSGRQWEHEGWAHNSAVMRGLHCYAGRSCVTALPVRPVFALHPACCATEATEATTAATSSLPASGVTGPNVWHCDMCGGDAGFMATPPLDQQGTGKASAASPLPTPQPSSVCAHHSSRPLCPIPHITLPPAPPLHAPPPPPPPPPSPNRGTPIPTQHPPPPPPSMFLAPSPLSDTGGRPDAYWAGHCHRHAAGCGGVWVCHGAPHHPGVHHDAQVPHQHLPRGHRHTGEGQAGPLGGGGDRALEHGESHAVFCLCLGGRARALHPGGEQAQAHPHTVFCYISTPHTHPHSFLSPTHTHSPTPPNHHPPPHHPHHHTTTTPPTPPPHPPPHPHHTTTPITSALTPTPPPTPNPPPPRTPSCAPSLRGSRST